MEFYAYGFEPNPGLINDPIKGTLYTGRFIEQQSDNGAWYRCFVNCLGKYISMERVSYLTGSFYPDGGTERYPRAFRMAKDESILREGDIVVYTTLYNSPTDYLILGALRHSLHNNDDIKADYSDIVNCDTASEVRDNALRKLVVRDNADGEVSVSLTGKETPARLKVTTNGTVDITVTDEDGTASQIIFNSKDKLLDITDKHGNRVQFNKDGAVLQVSKIKIGQMLELINRLFDAIQTMTLKTNTGATIPEPINWTAFKQIKDTFNEFMTIDIIEPEDE